MAPSSPPLGRAGLSPSIPVSLIPFPLLTIFQCPVTLSLALIWRLSPSFKALLPTSLSDVAFHFLLLLSNQLDKQLQLPVLLFFMGLFEIPSVIRLCYSIPCPTSPVTVKWLSHRCRFVTVVAASASGSKPNRDTAVAITPRPPITSSCGML